MTIVYFVRHAEPNYSNQNDLKRELTEKGMIDRKLVTDYLIDKNVDVILSSPFKRSYDTVKHFADISGQEIRIIEDFRERKIDDSWIDDFSDFAKKQWGDFLYKLPNGESLSEVQKRNITALEEVLTIYQGKTIVIGSHGTSLCTIINYYDENFNYNDFMKIRNYMPWIVKFVFKETVNQEIEYIEV